MKSIGMKLNLNSELNSELNEELKKTIPKSIENLTYESILKILDCMRCDGRIYDYIVNSETKDIYIKPLRFDDEFFKLKFVGNDKDIDN